MFVSVVSKNAEPVINQRACFLGGTKDEAIQKALRTRESWEHGGKYGPYSIFVGELTERVYTPLTEYTLEKL